MQWIRVYVNQVIFHASHINICVADSYLPLLALPFLIICPKSINFISLRFLKKYLIFLFIVITFDELYPHEIFHLRNLNL